MDNRIDPFNASAYGGDGWRPRTTSLQEEVGRVWGTCGVSCEWAPLESILVHRPGPELAASSNPNAVQMLAPLELARAQAQHDAMAEAYRQAGITVNYVDPPQIPSPNQMFVADLMFMTPEGAVIARPASVVRAGEERHVARRLADMGIPILRTIRGHGVFEGADALWLDPETVLLGNGLRTNAEGAAQVSGILKEMGVKTIRVDLPPGAMHLMGILRFPDRDLALARPKRLAHGAVDALRERGYRVVSFPDETEAVKGQACNFVTLKPGEILMPAGNPVTRAFLEDLGVTCRTVEVNELVKAAGAIGCLTGVLHRQTQSGPLF